MALMQQRAVLENAILARQLNDPLYNAESVARLVGLQQAADQFDQGMKLENSKLGAQATQFDKGLALERQKAIAGYEQWKGSDATSREAMRMEQEYRNRALQQTAQSDQARLEQGQYAVDQQVGMANQAKTLEGMLQMFQLLQGNPAQPEVQRGLMNALGFTPQTAPISNIDPNLIAKFSKGEQLTVDENKALSQAIASLFQQPQQDQWKYEAPAGIPSESLINF